MPPKSVESLDAGPLNRRPSRKAITLTDAPVVVLGNLLAVEQAQH
jgi:hypothetical protein